MSDNIDVDKCIKEKKERLDYLITIEYSSLCNFIRRFESYVEDPMGGSRNRVINLQRVIELRMHKIKLDHCE